MHLVSMDLIYSWYRSDLC